MKKLSALLATALTTGCVSSSLITRQHEPEYEYEAGSVTISASAPMRWEELAGELRPEFNSPSALAHLNDVLAVTQSETASRREAVGVEAGVNVAGATTTRSGSRTENYGLDAQGRPTITSVTGSTTTNTSQQAPVAPQNVDAAISAPSNVFRDSNDPLNTTSTSVDPVLRARAAVALHQELVLLDNYLDHAYDPCLEEGWLVRTRLVSTPYARNQPFDAFSRIYGTYWDGHRWSSDGLRLVPLLVTDNFERSDTRRYEQLASQVQASMSGLSGVVAAGLGFNRYLNNLNAILGAQYNNLLTISQVDDNTLSVRLGAAFSPTARYEMQSRSYDITFLVLLDKEAMNVRRLNLLNRLWELQRAQSSREQGLAEAQTREQEQLEVEQQLRTYGRIRLGFYAPTELRHAESGRVLEPMEERERSRLFQRLRHHVEEAGGDRERDALAVLERLDTENPVRVWSSIGQLTSALDIPETLYGELVRWALAVDGSSAELPVTLGEVDLPAEQTGVFRDSLDGGARVRLVGHAGMNANALSARLLVGRVGGPVAPFSLVANSLEVSTEGAIDATFPSLGAIGVNADAAGVRLELSLRCPTGSGQGTSMYPLLRDRSSLASAPPASPSFAARAVTPTIAPASANNGAIARIAVLAVENRNNPYIAGYMVSVATGEGVIQSAARVGEGGGPLSARAIDPATNTVRLGRNPGAYNLEFSNLKPQTTIILSVQAIGEGGGIIEGEKRDVEIAIGAAAPPQPPPVQPLSTPP